jgi:cytochrome c oxidase subunit 2
LNLAGILLLPVEATRQAKQVDALFYGALILSGLVVLLVAGLIFGFGMRYRAASKVERKPLPEFLSREIEITWTLATLFLFAALFWWASTLSLIHMRPPSHTLDIRVVAKQWMWKIEQPSGVREIDTVHLPIDTPVQLLMTSQDVIHSFYVPAFRAKEDVLPDRVTRLWFTPDKLGTYPLRCAEVCGLYHSRMLGSVIVMPKPDYARWVDEMKRESHEPQTAARERGR